MPGKLTKIQRQLAVEIVQAQILNQELASIEFRKPGCRELLNALDQLQTEG